MRVKVASARTIDGAVRKITISAGLGKYIVFGCGTLLSVTAQSDSSSIASMTSISAPVHAQAASGDTSTAAWDEVIVKGYRYLDEDTSGITNLPLPIEKVPQSISIVNNDFVKAANLKDMGEIAQYTTGAIWGSYNPSDANEFWLRGFSANYAIDGLTIGYQIPEPDPAMLERYEVVKGPASVVYGAQSPGGIVNLVSKSAALNTPNYLEVLGGSWDRYRLEGQVGGKLNDAGTVRGIGVAAYEEGGSFVNYVKKNKSVFYGGVDFDLAEGLMGYVRTSYQRTENTPFNGIPTFHDGSPAPVSRSFFIGSSDLDNVSQTTRVDTGLSWQMSDLWSFDLKGLYHKLTHDGGNEYNYDTITSDGSFTYGGEKFIDWHIDDYTIASSATRKLDDFGLTDSTISANIRYQHYHYYDHELTGGGNPPNPNIYDGDKAISDIFNAFTPTNDYVQDQTMNYLTASTQAVVKVASQVTLVGGIAYSKPTIDQQVNSAPSKSFDPGDQVNYRGALMYEPINGLNFYASYSESFMPNLRVDRSYNVLTPLSGKQYEIGMKNLSEDGKLLLTAAVFEIRESNIPVFDISDIYGTSLYKTQDVRHRGLELEATGRITDRWQVRGGGALLDAKVMNDPNSPVNNGETRPWLPKTTANLYTSYDVTDRFSLSGGARYVGAVKTYDNASAFSTPDIAAYTVFDAAANYSLDLWHLQLNLKNLFDKHYYVGSPIWQSLAAGLYPGEPRSIAVSVRRYF